ncbi:radical SAM protein [Clostridium botulinum]|uniref:Fe-S protein n=1 Tax=Clostridium botulinum C/D str. DC5 TaxID=1443128 RepID=A0A0A0I3P6_CLOBO|nr:radical SAM protein [Clostridium botulinum]KEI00707.1 Fe-S protein [Clostridium botulinum C/D str. BKT75002]KEI08453.1 Fe-S protein [Clostridium botulinum C/D str. BKT2873]KGM96029.1 Fe-S protein [Clostridium botulinum C/D str. DC5]KGM96712.1 Fe-S protein [Clostridium botulinum D str. CCUG 7971]KOC51282.1 Fe-S protein [Clostridium botulinum]
MLNKCNLCYRNCGVNRLDGELGFCKSSDKVKLARVSLHHWEEPCISGTSGSGTIFFSNCNLKCVFCQNHLISTNGIGKEISIERLSKIFLEQQNNGAHNINLVTPSHFVPQIIKALKIAKNKGLTIPIVYNTNSYENVETIQALKGYIDIYLPDFKYYKDLYAIKYSNAPNYFKVASKVILEMFHQVGKPKFDENGLMTRGIIVRHLMIPGLLFDSKKIIDYLYNNYKNSIYISIMNQYTPTDNLINYPEINKTINPKHYGSLIDYCVSLGITNAFIQDAGTATESFIPNFDLRGI